MRFRASLSCAALVGSLSAPVQAQGTCEALKGLRLSHAAVTAATTVPAGRFTPPPSPIPAEPVDLPAYCRVEAVSHPTGDSEIKFEVWLPLGAAWNGKFQQMGNGGYAGSIMPAVLAAGVTRGSATAATDDGHVGPDPSFAIGHPEKVVDFGHRAVHETADQAKAIVQAFYGKPPARSYFFGCSDGGREALMEAQRYPADFDGIVVGAPANHWTGLLTGAVWNWRALNATPASMIPVTKLPAIQAAAVKACDATDGVKDGLIEDPRRCRFDPAVLRCAGADNPGCLTAAQITALTQIYQGPKSPKTQQQIFPGMVPGTEAFPGNWSPWLVGASPVGLPLQAWFGTTFYSNMVYEDPKWDYHTFDLDRDYAKAVTKTSGSLDSNDPNLAPFRDRGGKLIQYHGWGDAAINGNSSIDYYERVKQKLEGSNGKPIADFYRLFMVPGMGHCAGGAGPNSFGNGLGGLADADHDVRAALERWVERGIAPDRLIASGIRSGEPVGDPAKETKLTRPLCAYPKTAQYTGTGSTDDAASFTCSVPKP
jgi:feruloyl esterase